MFSLDTRFNVTPVGLAVAKGSRRRRDPRAVYILPTQEGIDAALPLIEARDAVLEPVQPVVSEVCDCGTVATVDYFGRRFCQPCVDFMEAQASRCIGTRYED